MYNERNYHFHKINKLPFVRRNWQVRERGVSGNFISKIENENHRMSTLIDVRSGDAQFTAVVVHSGTQTLTHSSNEEHARIIIEPNAEMKAKNTFISLAVMQSILCASFD